MAKKNKKMIEVELTSIPERTNPIQTSTHTKHLPCHKTCNLVHSIIYNRARRTGGDFKREDEELDNLDFRQINYDHEFQRWTTRTPMISHNNFRI